MRKRVTVLHRYRNEFQARQAARQRLPVWLGLLMPFTSLFFIPGTAFLFITVANGIHGFLHPVISGLALSEPVEALIFVSSFFAALGPGLMAANLALCVVPPVRRALDENAKGVPAASFQASMRGLSKMSMITVPAGLFLTLLGAVEPWAYWR